MKIPETQGLPATGDIALKLADRAVSFAELSELVEKKTAELRRRGPAPVLVIECGGPHAPLETIAQILAALDAQVPAALLGARLSPTDKARRLQLLASPLHPEARLILFTSGSSGQLKAVQLSRTNIDSNILAVTDSLSFGSAAEQHLFLPLEYSFGLLGQLLPALRAGIPSQLYEDFARFNAQTGCGGLRGMISGVPSHYEALVRAIPEAQTEVTHLVTAGAALSVDLRRRLLAAFPQATIYTCYGQTEASPRILCLRSDHPGFLEGYTGFAVGDWRLRLGPGDELQIQGAQVMLGYAGCEPTTSADTWLGTGDLAEIRADGLVKVLGRRDDQVKVGGERISLIEVENELKDALGTDKLAVTAIEDPILGWKIVAIIADPGIKEAGESGARKRVLERISAHKRPAIYKFVLDLPVLTNGKLDRACLRKLAN